ncbi:MAG: protein kinase [Archangiaceae bacterium]|nr:protein kinase [Archangiaceae bacterium]
MSEAVTAPGSKQRSCQSCGEPLESSASTCPKCGAVAPPGDVAPPAADAAAVSTTPGGPAAPPAAPKPTDLEVSETLLGQWKLESKIGEGGMGNVFLATEMKLGRKVAVKVLSINNLQDETVKRFEREAQVMGKLDHPNIVTLYAVGRHRDVPFLVMRYLEGGSLWDLLDANGGRLTPEQLLPLVKQLCSALGYIHGKNLIHRDLKPSNIFISPQGKVTLLDLGLARGHTTALTRTGIIWGTPDFMAPEQIVGEKQLDGRADLYALGVVLYRMISNQPPFPDEDEQDLMRAHLTRPRPDITKVWGGATPALALMLQKAMAIKPEDRFQTAEEMSQAFERAAVSREAPTRATANHAVPASVKSAAAAAAPVPAPKPSAPAEKAPPPASAPKPPASSEKAPAPPAPSPAASSPPATAAKTLAAAPAAPPVAPPQKPPVTTAVPAQLTGKHKVIDELDDDATEMGELSPELLGIIAAAEAQESTASGPVDEGPETLPPEPVTQGPGPLPFGTKSSDPVPRKSAGPVPTETVASPNRRSGVTAFDRPPQRAAPSDSSLHGSEVTAPEGIKRPIGLRTAEPDTGPEQAVQAAGAVVDAVVDADLDDPKTEIGGLVDPATKVAATAAPVYEPTKAVPAPRITGTSPAYRSGNTPAPRVSAPRPARKSAVMPPHRKEPTGVQARNEEPLEESPPWMHPYVLVTGGLLLLALGFLIGVLLR